MWLNLVYIVQISVILGDIPEFGAVGNYKCYIQAWHYATNFYAGGDLNKARERCTKFDCDVIIEWTRQPRDKRMKATIGWDLGKFDAPPCPQNEDMTAKIIWEKKFEDYMNPNNITTGLIGSL